MMKRTLGLDFERAKNEKIVMEGRNHELDFYVEQMKEMICSLETQMRETQNKNLLNDPPTSPTKFDSLLQENYQQLETENRQLRLESKKYIVQVESLKSDMSKMSGGARGIEEKFRKEFEEIRSEKLVLEKDCETLETVRKQSEARRRILEQQLEQANSERMDLLENNRKRVLTSNRDFQDKALATESELMSERKQKSELQNSLAESRAEFNAYKKSALEVKGRFDGRLDEIQNQLKEAERKRNANSQENRVFQMDKTRLKDELKRQKEELVTKEL